MHSRARQRNPRLLLVTRALDVGGTERHLAQIAPGLARRGFDVSLYCLAKEGAQVAEVGASGIRVVGARPGAGLLPRLGSAATLAAGALGLIPEMLLQRPDIAHFFLPHAFLAGSVAAALTQVPVRIMSRRCQNLYQLKHPVLARLERRLHGTMTAILGNSQRIVDELIGEEGVPASRTGLIYNGSDLARFQSPVDRVKVRAKLGIDPTTTVIACLANLMSYKGHAELLVALAAIKDRLPKHWKLLAIGRDGGTLADLKAQTSALGLEENVLWLGLRRDVADLLRASDIGVLASHEEGFSNAIIESMASGLPMVVTNAGGNAEAVPHGICGLVTPAHDPGALAQAIARLALDPSLAARMGAASRRHAGQNFSLEACLDKYEATYRALLAGKNLPVGVAAAWPNSPRPSGRPVAALAGGSFATPPRPSREATAATFAQPS